MFRSWSRAKKKKPMYSALCRADERDFQKIEMLPSLWQDTHTRRRSGPLTSLVSSCSAIYAVRRWVIQPHRQSPTTAVCAICFITVQILATRRRRETDEPARTPVPWPLWSYWCRATATTEPKIWVANASCAHTHTNSSTR